MMKKLLACLLVLVLCFSFVACNNEPVVPGDNGDEPLAAEPMTATELAAQINMMVALANEGNAEGEKMSLTDLISELKKRQGEFSITMPGYAAGSMAWKDGSVTLTDSEGTLKYTLFVDDYALVYDLNDEHVEYNILSALFSPNAPSSTPDVPSSSVSLFGAVFAYLFGADAGTLGDTLQGVEITLPTIAETELIADGETFTVSLDYVEKVALAMLNGIADYLKPSDQELAAIRTMLPGLVEDLCPSIQIATKDGIVTGFSFHFEANEDFLALTELPIDMLKGGIAIALTADGKNLSSLSLSGCIAEDKGFSATATATYVDGRPIITLQAEYLGDLDVYNAADMPSPEADPEDPIGTLIRADAHLTFNLTLDLTGLGTAVDNPHYALITASLESSFSNPMMFDLYAGEMGEPLQVPVTAPSAVQVTEMQNAVAAFAQRLKLSITAERTGASKDTITVTGAGMPEGAQTVITLDTCEAEHAMETPQAMLPYIEKADSYAAIFQDMAADLTAASVSPFENYYYKMTDGKYLVLDLSDNATFAVYTTQPDGYAVICVDGSYIVDPAQPA